MSKKRKKIKTLIINLLCSLFLNLNWEDLISYKIVDFKTWQLHYPNYKYHIYMSWYNEWLTRLSAIE